MKFMLFIFVGLIILSIVNLMFLLNNGPSLAYLLVFYNDIILIGAFLIFAFVKSMRTLRKYNYGILLLLCAAVYFLDKGSNDTIQKAAIAFSLAIIALQIIEAIVFRKAKIHI